MADDVETPEVEETDDDKSIWEILGVSDPDEEEPFQAEAEAEEVKAVEEDKLAKKLAGRVDNLEKKFKQNVLKERTEKFLSGADDLETDLFKAIAGDVKDPETLDRATKLVKERAANLRSQAAKYEEEMKAKAEESAQRAWGAAPVGVAAARTESSEEEQQKRIAAGDTAAGLAALLGGDVIGERALYGR